MDEDRTTVKKKVELLLMKEEEEGEAKTKKERKKKGGCQKSCRKKRGFCNGISTFLRGTSLTAALPRGAHLSSMCTFFISCESYMTHTFKVSVLSSKKTFFLSFFGCLLISLHSPLLCHAFLPFDLLPFISSFSLSPF